MHFAFKKKKKKYNDHIEGVEKKFQIIFSFWGKIFICSISSSECIENKNTICILFG